MASELGTSVLGDLQPSIASPVFISRIAAAGLNIVFCMGIVAEGVARDVITLPARSVAKHRRHCEAQVR